MKADCRSIGHGDLLLDGQTQRKKRFREKLQVRVQYLAVQKLRTSVDDLDARAVVHGRWISTDESCPGSQSTTIKMGRQQTVQSSMYSWLPAEVSMVIEKGSPHQGQSMCSS